MYCLNPACTKPQNADTDRCHNCGFALALRDRYAALRLLGQSGSGRTLLAIDATTQAHCVIKQSLSKLRTEGHPFWQEVDWLAQVKHPQIPRLIDAFEQDDRLYLIQEFIAGQPLAAALKAQGTFTEAQIWQILTSLLPVIEFVHQHQVMHRDIKPENIIRGVADRLYLVDFSAASDLAGEAIGSPEYAAPEQTWGKAVYASDLYSLGLTCIHLLTEISPFDLSDSSTDRWLWRSCLPQPVSDRLAQILDKLSQNAISQRFQSAAEVMKQLGIRQQVAAAKPIYQPLASITTPGTIHAIALAGSALVSAGDDKIISLWDATSLHPISRFTGHKGRIRSLAFSPDAAILASAGDDKVIRLWDWRSGRMISTLSGHTASVRSIQFSPEGRLLASGSWDKTIRLWQIKPGEEATRLVGHTLQVTSVACSPDGKWLASGSCDRTVCLWRLSGQPEATQLEAAQTLLGHAWTVLTVAFSPDSSLLATGSEDNTVKLWEVETGRLIRTIAGHSWAIAAVVFSRDGKTLISASWDKSIQLWDVDSGRLRAKLAGHADSIHAIVVQPLNDAVWSGGRDRQLYQWQA